VPDDAVRAAVEQIDRTSEREAAEALVNRRLGSLSGVDPAVQARRLVGLLARKGYSPGLAHEVVRAVLRDNLAVELAGDADLPPDD
jgi:regulatory protein